MLTMLSAGKLSNYCSTGVCYCSWDRVVPESYLLKNNDDNRVLMRKLALISQKE